MGYAADGIIRSESSAPGYRGGIAERGGPRRSITVEPRIWYNP